MRKGAFSLDENIGGGTVARMKQFYAVFWIIMATVTAMVGHTIHGGTFWTVMNFIFWPISWVKWLVCHDVNLTLIKQTFSFFLS